MPTKAHVSSIDAIQDFRANLIIYLSKARPTLEEVTADIMRMKQWLEHEQRTHWETQVRRRLKELEQAQQALFSARIANLREETTAEQTAYHRARRLLDDAEGKLRLVKRWGREFDGRAQPLVKQMEKLHTFLSNDLVKAVALLAETAQKLRDYAGLTPPPGLASNEPGGGGQGPEPKEGDSTA